MILMSADFEGLSDQQVSVVGMLWGKGIAEIGFCHHNLVRKGEEAKKPSYAEFNADYANLVVSAVHQKPEHQR